MNAPSLIFTVSSTLKVIFGRGFSSASEGLLERIASISDCFSGNGRWASQDPITPGVSRRNCHVRSTTTRLPLALSIAPDSS